MPNETWVGNPPAIALAQCFLQRGAGKRRPQLDGGAKANAEQFVQEQTTDEGT